MLRFNPLLLIGFFSILLTTLNANEEKILPYPIYQHKLVNGLNVVTVPFDSPEFPVAAREYRAAVKLAPGTAAVVSDA